MMIVMIVMIMMMIMMDDDDDDEDDDDDDDDYYKNHDNDNDNDFDNTKLHFTLYSANPLRAGVCCVCAGGDVGFRVTGVRRACVCVARWCVCG